MKLFHKHKWKTIDNKLVNIYDGTKIPVEYKYVEIQKCEECGKIRKQTVKF